MVDDARQPYRRHIWLVLAAGRICNACLLVQPHGEFVSGPCPGRAG
jgi:hypothetical protein